MKRKSKAAFLLILLCSMLTACGMVRSGTTLQGTALQKPGVQEFAAQEAKWGSFTSDKTYSYDDQYYALQTVEENMGMDYIVVSVYDAGTDELLGDFSPARAFDFWGICWESDTYNIWIQSADIGTFCYAYEDGQWTLDREAERPADIISKYDKSDDAALKMGDRRI